MYDIDLNGIRFVFDAAATAQATFHISVACDLFIYYFFFPPVHIIIRRVFCLYKTIIDILLFVLLKKTLTGHRE